MKGVKKKIILVIIKFVSGMVNGKIGVFIFAKNLILNTLEQLSLDDCSVYNPIASPAIQPPVQAA